MLYIKVKKDGIKCLVMLGELFLFEPTKGITVKELIFFCKLLSKLK